MQAVLEKYVNDHVLNQAAGNHQIVTSKCLAAYAGRCLRLMEMRFHCQPSLKQSLE